MYLDAQLTARYFSTLPITTTSSAGKKEDLSYFTMKGHVPLPSTPEPPSQLPQAAAKAERPSRLSAFLHRLCCCCCACLCCWPSSTTKAKTRVCGNPYERVTPRKKKRRWRWKRSNRISCCGIGRVRGGRMGGTGKKKRRTIESCLLYTSPSPRD